MTTDDSVYMVLELPSGVDSKNLNPGASLTLTDLHTVEPIVTLQDGSKYSAKYEESLGTQLIFLQDETGKYSLAHKTDVVLRTTYEQEGPELQASQPPAQPGNQ